MIRILKKITMKKLIISNHYESLLYTHSLVLVGYRERDDADSIAPDHLTVTML